MGIGTQAEASRKDHQNGALTLARLAEGLKPRAGFLSHLDNELRFQSRQTLPGRGPVEAGDGILGVFCIA
jgi:hypothetical protein